MTRTRPKRAEGWHQVQTGAVRHFFTEDGRSLCGRWLLTDHRRSMLKNTASDHDDEENCPTCVRLRLERARVQ